MGLEDLRRDLVDADLIEDWHDRRACLAAVGARFDILLMMMISGGGRIEWVVKVVVIGD